MSTERDRPGPAPTGSRASGPPAAWPGALIGAALGGVVGALSLLVPVDPAPFPGGSGATTGSASATMSAGATGSAGATMSAASASVAPGGSGAASGGAAASGSAAGDETEADYLARATGLIGGAPGEALALAEGHAARFPEGKLGQEREMIAISALAALGRKAQARARARLFLTLFPESSHRPRLEELVPELVAPKKPAAP